MKLTVETVIDPHAPELAGWGLDTKTGDVFLQVVVGSKRVRVECSPEEAKEIGCGGIVASHAGATYRAQRAATQPGIVHRA